MNRIDVGTVCVDVANVWHDEALAGPLADRLDAVEEAWRAQLSRHAQFLLAADRSLLGELAPEDRRHAQRMQADGELTVVADADEALLGYASRQGACVLSHDRFLDKRPGWPWVPERFFEWEVEDGVVRIVRRRSRNTQPFDISRAVEQKALRRQRITRGRALALRRWVCTSDVPCLTREMTPGGLQALPVERAGVPCCPGCGRPLRDRGRRELDAELKLLVDDVVHLRFTLAPERPLTFGRLVLPDTAELAQLARAGVLDGLGRRHVALARRTDGLAVRPVDDRHAVWQRPWDRGARRFGRRRRLSAREPTVIGLRDQLLLTDHVVLLRSGRSIAEAEELGEGPGAEWQLTPTGDR